MLQILQLRKLFTGRQIHPGQASTYLLGRYVLPLALHLGQGTLVFVHALDLQLRTPTQTQSLQLRA